MLRWGGALAMAMALAPAAPAAVASEPLPNYGRERPPSHAQASPPGATEPPRSPQSKAQGKPRTEPYLPTAAKLRTATGYTKLIEHAGDRPQVEHGRPGYAEEPEPPPTYKEPPPTGPTGPPSHAEPSHPAATELPSHEEVRPTGTTKQPRSAESKARGKPPTKTAPPEYAEPVSYTEDPHRAGRARSVRARKPRSLPFTGLDLRSEIGVGILLIAAGCLITIVGRRRSNGWSPLRRQLD
jgi:hypothetical protein